MSEVKPFPPSDRLAGQAAGGRGLGTALLVTVVVGSGDRGRRLSPTDTGLQLLENSTATVFGLAVLILIFGPVSGAHFNPVVSAADWLLTRRPRGGRVCRGTREVCSPTRSPRSWAVSSGRCWPT